MAVNSSRGARLLMEKTIELPWPPSVNHYLKKAGRRMIKTERAQEYCYEVFYRVKKQKIGSFGNSRVEAHIKAYPPDRRKRDIDNLTKMIFDSLEHSGVYDNDNQIDYFSVRRMEHKKGGKILVTIKAIDN